MTTKKHAGHVWTRIKAPWAYRAWARKYPREARAVNERHEKESKRLTARRAVVR